jgi:hypothetical protein
MAIGQERLLPVVVDGASGFGLFRYVTFPLLSPVTFFLFIMNMVFSFFETFGIIDPDRNMWVATFGGDGYGVDLDDVRNGFPTSSRVKSTERVGGSRFRPPIWS